MIEFEPLWLTLKLAFVTTLILLVISIPLAWWLAYKKNNFKTVVEAVVSMPLVLPPSVIGFYLLLLNHIWCKQNNFLTIRVKDSIVLQFL